MSAEDIKSWAFFRVAVLRALMVVCLIVFLAQGLRWQPSWAIVIGIFGGAFAQVVWDHYLVPRWKKSKSKGAEGSDSL